MRTACLGWIGGTCSTAAVLFFARGIGALVGLGIVLGLSLAAAALWAAGVRRTGRFLIALDDAMGTFEPPRRRGSRDVIDDWQRERV